MRFFSALLLAAASARAYAAVPAQQPLVVSHEVPEQRKLTGRFLHITDLHPDPYYKLHSDIGEESPCHSGKGRAGFYGAENSDCDTPLSLVNATFDWIKDNIRDDIDFVVWTGDSARHDNDESIPRSDDQVLGQNQMMVDKFIEVFGKPDNINDTDPTNDLIIPIIPSFGNNDILPHNIFLPGPNKWTHNYRNIWRTFVPELQTHSFDYGGWYFVEVIPNKLAVFSLNTLYFFSSNSAVDGCDKKSEPGHDQMEWLRIQLQFMRERGMKVILSGHVPPARTESKMSWDETCWQKYTLWMHQYRDIVIASLYGHMNIDHFIFQDTKSLDIAASTSKDQLRTALDSHLTINSVTDYLSELRDEFSKLPDPPTLKKADKDREQNDLKKPKSSKKLRKDFYKSIGGQWGERYSMSIVSGSVVPNYFPSLRVIEYNITGLDLSESSGDLNSEKKKKKHKKHKKKKPKKPNFTVPAGPDKASPPGPAYSPQTFTLLGYKQYFANLTRINNEPRKADVDAAKKKTKPFSYELEYDSTDPKDLYKLEDMTVRSYMKLAMRISGLSPGKWPFDLSDEEEREIIEDVDCPSSQRFKKPKHPKKDKIHNKMWKNFLRRAFIGAVADEDLDDAFGVSCSDEEANSHGLVEL